MNKDKIKQIKKDRLVSIDNVIIEPMPKRPSEYTNAEFEKDFIRLDKIIVRTSLSVVFLTLTGMLYVLFY